MTEDELADVGRRWLRVVALVREQDIQPEHDHVRFRDSDLSVKGAAVLGFAGLMLAADLVFLSAGDGSLIKPEWSCGAAGLGSMLVILLGAFCAVASIMISRNGSYASGWSSFGLMKIYHDRRRRWLAAASILTLLGTTICLAAMTAQFLAKRCW